MKNTTTKEQTAPKTVKVKTLILAGVAMVAIIASFLLGAASANSFNQTVEAKALERVSAIESKLNQ